MSNSEKPPKPRPDDAEAHPYVLTNEIGEGSFATVYRGYHVKDRKAVAVKAVRTSILKAKLLDNLESEIAILKSLNHRHITALIDIVKAEKHVYIVMDYCSGGDLSQYIKARGKIETLSYVPEPGAAPIYFPHPKTGGLDQRVVRSLLLQLADALRFLRNRNLMHRDLKPQNLLLQPAAPDDIALGHTLGAPILKVADFGFARILPTSALADTLCGSPLYMAPEILGYEKYDAKADLWSVGAVLYEMSVGKPPFRANNHIELANKIKKANSRVPFPDEDPKKAAEATPVPADIKQLIRMLLRRNPVERADYDEFFKAPALEGLSSPFFTHARGLASFAANPTPPTSSKSAMPAVTLLESSRPAPKPPTPASSSPAPTPSTSTSADPKAPPQEMLIGPDGQPYDPRLYQIQDTFHVKRKKHRDKDRERRHGEKNGTSEPSAEAVDRRAAGKTSPLLSSLNMESVLKQDYVVVDDTRAVEFNRVADGLSLCFYEDSQCH
ncbi:kinase-like protein [Clavulina sp. PMI_390]|nr:kinase-like protein [Clavulina sp. PMI_390]